MKREKDIRDDEIRVLGNSSPEKTAVGRPMWYAVAVLVAVTAVAAGIYALTTSREAESTESYFEPEAIVTVQKPAPVEMLGSRIDPKMRGFTELRDTLINDIPLQLALPHNAEPMLCVGEPPLSDTSVVYCAQAADIRRDNRRIVGAFVLKGEPLAWGLSKKGYCAIIDGHLRVGVSEDSPLFEEATRKEGYFFRQYALVDNGQLVENEPKNKSVRRALCERRGEIVVVSTLTEESFHDFAQALVDLGMTHAIYLVGSASYGWAVDAQGEMHEFGTRRTRQPRFTSYIVWKRQ